MSIRCSKSFGTAPFREKLVLVANDQGISPGTEPGLPPQSEALLGSLCSPHPLPDTLQQLIPLDGKASCDVRTA